MSSVLDQAVVALSGRDVSTSQASDEAVGVLLAATGSLFGADSDPALNNARLQILTGLRSLRLVAEALHPA